MDKLGEYIKEKMDLLSLNKSEMAVKLGISSQLLGMYISGTRTPKTEFYLKWEEAFKENIYKTFVSKSAQLAEPKASYTETKRKLKNVTDKNVTDKNLTDKMLADLVESNKMLAEANINYSKANLNFSEVNKSLIENMNGLTNMIVNSGGRPENIAAFQTMCADVREVLAELHSSGAKYKSKSEALAAVHKIWNDVEEGR